MAGRLGDLVGAEALTADGLTQNDLFLVGTDELGDGTVEGDHAVLADGLNLDTEVGIVEGGGGVAAHGAGLEAVDGVGDVLGLDVAGEGVELTQNGGAAAAEVGGDVNDVNALVHRGAAAVEFPRAAPVTAVVVALASVPGGNDPGDTADVAEDTGFNVALQGLAHRALALVEHNAEDQAALFGGFVHFPNGAGENTGGLFGKNVNALGKCLLCDNRVEIVGGGDDDGVDDTACDHFVHIGEEDKIFLLFLGPGQSVFLQVANRNQLGVFDFAIGKAANVAAAHVTYADDTNAYFIHNAITFPYDFLHYITGLALLQSLFSGFFIASQ